MAPFAEFCSMILRNCLFEDETDVLQTMADDLPQATGIVNKRQPVDEQQSMLTMLKEMVECESALERAVRQEVSAAVETLLKNNGEEKVVDSSPASMLRVAAHLQACGRDAAVCTTQWSAAQGIPGGEYRFIDVTAPPSPGGAEGASTSRILVDLSFRHQFQIARPTPMYAAALEVLPAVLVAESSRLQAVIALMAQQCKRSMEQKGMPLPPWRSLRFMRAKWLSPGARQVLPSPAPQTPEPTGEPLSFAASVPAQKMEMTWEQPMHVRLSVRTLSGSGFSASSFQPPTAPKAPAPRPEGTVKKVVAPTPRKLSSEAPKESVRELRCDTQRRVRDLRRLSTMAVHTARGHQQVPTVPTPCNGKAVDNLGWQFPPVEQPATPSPKQSRSGITLALQGRP